MCIANVLRCEPVNRVCGASCDTPAGAVANSRWEASGFMLAHPPGQRTPEPAPVGAADPHYRAISDTTTKASFRRRSTSRDVNASCPLSRHDSLLACSGGGSREHHRSSLTSWCRCRGMTRVCDDPRSVKTPGRATAARDVLVAALPRCALSVSVVIVSPISQPSESSRHENVRGAAACRFINEAGRTSPLYSPRHVRYQRHLRVPRRRSAG